MACISKRAVLFGLGFFAFPLCNMIPSRAQQISIRMTGPNNGAAVAADDQLINGQWTDSSTSYAGVSITTDFSCNALTYNSFPWGYLASISGSALNSTTGPSTLPNLDAPLATLLGLSQDSGPDSIGGSGWGYTSYGPYNAPPVGFWFFFQIGGSFEDGQTQNYSYAMGDGYSVYIDPTYLTVSYISPGVSSINYSYSVNAGLNPIQFASLDFGIGALSGSGDNGLTQEYVDGIWISQDNPSDSPLNLTNLNLIRVLMECNDDRDELAGEYVDDFIQLAPACSDWTQTATPGGYTFQQYNVANDSTWALARLSLTVPLYYSYGLDYFMNQYQSMVPPITPTLLAGYRSPSAALPSGFGSGDRTMFDDGVIFANAAHSEAYYETMQIVAGLSGGYVLAYTSLPNGSRCNPLVCIQVDWKAMSGLYS